MLTIQSLTAITNVFSKVESKLSSVTLSLQVMPCSKCVRSNFDTSEKKKKHMKAVLGDFSKNWNNNVFIHVCKLYKRLMECGIDEKVTMHRLFQENRKNESRQNQHREECVLFLAYHVIFFDMWIPPGVSFDTFCSYLGTSPFAQAVQKEGQTHIEGDKCKSSFQIH